MLAAVVVASGRGASWAAETGPVIDDWTHHRLMFSDPGTLADALLHGRVNEWLRVTNDPRFKLQQLKRQAARDGGAKFAERLKEPQRHQQFIEDQPERRRRRAMPENLPPGALSVTEAERILGVQAPPQEERRHRRHPRASGALDVDWSEDMGTAASARAGIFPAKFSFSLTTANCASAANPDFVVYNTGGTGVAAVSGTGGQATIIAYGNLYTGCAAPVPTVYWAYNTGTGSTITSSPTLSPDGTQVAFVQSNGTSATLVILKWAASASETESDPDTLPVTPASSFRSCSAPCMTTIAFGNGLNDSASSPFPDYSAADAIYVGDDGGKLHKFTGVFAGTPAEVTTSPWPVSVGSQPLDGPILDSASGRIFVGDYSSDFTSGATSSPCGTAGCGVLHSVTAATGAMFGTSSRLDSQYGLADSPLVDSNAGRVYVFAGADTSISCTLSPCGGVYQFPTNFTSGTGTEAKLGAGLLYLLAGSFDNAYLTSANAASPTGHIYVVGGTGLANNTLYQISIASNVMSTTVVTGPELADNFLPGLVTQGGLSVTEIVNGAHDYIFLSVLSDGFPSGCGGGGCVIGYDVASGTISGSTTPAFAVPETNGTSGIIIDNTSSFSGASQIYFTPLGSQACGTSGTGRCAIQLGQ